MDNFGIEKIISALQVPEIFLKKKQGTEKTNQSSFSSFTANINTGLNNNPAKTNIPIQNSQQVENIPQQLQINTIPNVDRAVFIKNILGLPQDLGTVLFSLQNKNLPLLNSTLNLNNTDNINQEILKNQQALAEIFDETTDNINDVVSQINQNINNTQVQTKNDIVALFFSGMISMNDVSKLIIEHGKKAVASLIIAMASSSKNGVNNNELQETLSVINSCISMAEQEDSAQTLKSLLMLYLPWLPLNEGIGFDLEISQPAGEKDSNNSKLTVLIQTKHYGNLKGDFTLLTSNSVDVLIMCSDKFPKKVLEQVLDQDSQSHAMNTSIAISDITPLEDTQNETNETKVNLSATNEMNPYLLLMAHSFIRNTIMIDNNAVTC